MAPVGLLLNPPKSSQSDVSYVSYESGELCKKKNQEKLEEYKTYIADARALANPTPPTSTRMGKGIGQGSSVPRPPSSPPPGGGYKGFGKASQKRRMIGEGRGEATILPATSKAKPRKGKGKPRPTSKGLEEERLANEEETNQAEAKKRRLIAQGKSGGKQLRPSGKDRPSGSSSSSSSSQLQGKGKAAPDAPWRQNFNKVLFV